MKELSIEEKAARYDEAIQRANNIREGKCKNVFVYNHYNQGLIEYLFNELSEDERIRKALRERIIRYDPNNEILIKEEGISQKQFLAWLEKQGKQNPTDKVTEEEKPLLEKLKQAVYDCARGKVTCKIEGESKEEYANRWAERLLTTVRDWADDYIDFTVQQKLRKSCNKPKEDAIKENIHAWNEDDYNEIETIACHLDNTDNEGMAEMLRNIRDKYYQIIPQNRWKPSDDQITWLYRAADDASKGSRMRQVLNELLSDLKKLRGE